MQVSFRPAAITVSFNGPKRVSSTGLISFMAMAKDTRLHDSADQHLTVPTNNGCIADL